MREAGVSNRLGLCEEKLVSRVKDEPMPLGVSFLDGWLPIRNIDFHGLVGVEDPLRVTRRLSVDLECEKTPRVCRGGVGMRDVWKERGKVTGREGAKGRGWMGMGRSGDGEQRAGREPRPPLQAFLMSIFGKSITCSP